MRRPLAKTNSFLKTNETGNEGLFAANCARSRDRWSIPTARFSMVATGALQRAREIAGQPASPSGARGTIHVGFISRQLKFICQIVSNTPWNCASVAR